MLMMAALCGLMLFQIHRDLYIEKTERTHQLVESASGVLAYFHGLETSGELNREQAQAKAKEAIRGLRYSQVEYFWINDLRSVMVMHPVKRELEGQDLSGVKDPDGYFVFNEAVAIAKTSGSGPMRYRWSKTSASESVGKVSYVKFFEPWGWVLGTGVYVDDIREEFDSKVWQAVTLSSGIFVILALLILTISRSIVRPLTNTVNAMANIASGEGDLTRTLSADGNDEVTQLAIHFNAFTKKMQHLIRQLLQAASDLAKASTDLGAIAGQVQAHSHEQSQQMDLVATAIDEVTYAVQDVAKNAEHASGEVLEAEDKANHGQRSIDNSLQQVDQLSNTIAHAVEVIRTLSVESNKIGNVLEVIRSIAEQTNLLALNAAIEAARAGEQGRGFSVVADEVRLLAQRTQKSTAEIQEMIQRLQSQSDAAVKVIGDSAHASDLTMAQANKAGESLNSISHALRTLTQLNASIASATLQQSHVVEDVNKNVTHVAQLSQSTALAAQRSSQASAQLGHLSDQISNLLRQFKV
jgi:methyl-accepting chemotaxis protein